MNSQVPKCAHYIRTELVTNYADGVMEPQYKREGQNMNVCGPASEN